MGKEKPAISKDMTIGEVIVSYPQAAKVLIKHGFHCIGCPATAMETIEQGAIAHGMSVKVIDAMVKEMNRAVSKNK
jgi:hybrid cluster-associated redox disulfide protein